jgi:hypothetical protein
VLRRLVQDHRRAHVELLRLWDRFDKHGDHLPAHGGVVGLFYLRTLRLGKQEAVVLEEVLVDLPVRVPLLPDLDSFEDAREAELLERERRVELVLQQMSRK